MTKVECEAVRRQARRGIGNLLLEEWGVEGLVYLTMRKGCPMPDGTYYGGWGKEEYAQVEKAARAEVTRIVGTLRGARR